MHDIKIFLVGGYWISPAILKYEVIIVSIISDNYNIHFFFFSNIPINTAIHCHLKSYLAINLNWSIIFFAKRGKKVDARSNLYPSLLFSLPIFLETMSTLSSILSCFSKDKRRRSVNRPSWLGDDGPIGDRGVSETKIGIESKNPLLDTL